MANRLSITDLRRALDLMLDAAVEQFGPHIDLDFEVIRVAEYWDIHLRAAYDLVNHPEQEIVAGDVFDDLEEVMHFLQREGGEVYLWHDLNHAIGLLGMLAYLDLPPESPGGAR